MVIRDWRLEIRDLGLEIRDWELDQQSAVSCQPEFTPVSLSLVEGIPGERFDYAQHDKRKEKEYSCIFVSLSLHLSA